MRTATTHAVGAYRHRFRVNATSIQMDDQTGIHVVFRIHPNVPPPLEDLNLPPALQAVMLGVRRGLVLVTGPTGSGRPPPWRRSSGASSKTPTGMRWC
ncbi:MAG: hypothetical protein IPK53_10650 [bacterium]|nr:hypothetical protein [bacterium]